jgi:hypothetical protein
VRRGRRADELAGTEPTLVLEGDFLDGLRAGVSSVA